MKRPRDMQRQRVYDAEGMAFGESACEFDTLADVQEFVDRVCARKSVQARYPMAQLGIVVTDGRGRRRGRGGRRGIAVPRRTRSRWYVLHEVAHALTWPHREAGHGWRFCRCYLFLVQAFLGKLHADALRAAYKAKRVRYTKPRKT